MAGDEITIERLYELERKMDQRFSEILMKIQELTNAIENKDSDFLQVADMRYRKQENMVNDAMAILARPDVKERLHETARQALVQSETKVILKSIYCEFFNDSRDNLTKWINFLKLIAGAVIVGSLFYGGNSVVKSNQTTQRAVIEMLQQQGE